MARIRAAVVAVSLLLVGGAARGQDTSPVGVWKTYDDKTGKPRSFVRIEVEPDGQLEGFVHGVVPAPGQPEDPVCIKCKGSRQGEKIIGMQIMWGFREHGGRWSGGHVLDPESGKTYDGEIQIIDEGRRMKLHGYAGLKIFGRTQYWERVPGE